MADGKLPRHVTPTTGDGWRQALPSIRATLLPSVPFKLHDPDAIMTESEGLIRQMLLGG